MLTASLNERLVPELNSKVYWLMLKNKKGAA